MRLAVCLFYFFYIRPEKKNAYEQKFQQQKSNILCFVFIFSNVYAERVQIYLQL